LLGLKPNKNGSTASVSPLVPFGPPLPVSLAFIFDGGELRCWALKASRGSCGVLIFEGDLGLQRRRQIKRNVRALPDCRFHESWRDWNCRSVVIWTRPIACRLHRRPGPPSGSTSLRPFAVHESIRPRIPEDKGLQSRFRDLLGVQPCQFLRLPFDDGRK